MKGIEVIYKFGNLYDKATRKRILIEDGAQLVIAVPSEKLLEEDPNLKIPTILNAEQKKVQFKNKHGLTPYWKLFNAGDLLRFDISAGVRLRERKTVQIRCTFQLRLLEDLYVYNKKKRPKDARFFDCNCLVEECLTNFEFFEPLYAKSLNDAYTKTYELYFSMFGSPGANAFNRMYEIDPKKPVSQKTEEIQKRAPDNE